MSMAIADSEAFLKRNFLVLLDIEDGVQPARVGSQYPDFAAEQCPDSARVHSWNGWDRENKPGKRRNFMEDSHCSIKGCLQGNQYLFYKKSFQSVAKPYINFPAVRLLADCLFGY
jgi:hypothetical protein